MKNKVLITTLVIALVVVSAGLLYFVDGSDLQAKIFRGDVEATNIVARSELVSNGPAAVNSNITVKGKGDIKGDLSVEGNSFLNGQLTVNGSTTSFKKLSILNLLKSQLLMSFLRSSTQSIRLEGLLFIFTLLTSFFPFLLRLRFFSHHMFKYSVLSEYEIIEWAIKQPTLTLLGIRCLSDGAFLPNNLLYSAWIIILNIFIP